MSIGFVLKYFCNGSTISTEMNLKPAKLSQIGTNGCHLDPKGSLETEVRLCGLVHSPL